jgi:methyl-accepting chemotaxis protein
MKKMLIGPLVVLTFLMLMGWMAYRGMVDQKNALADVYQGEFKDYQLLAKVIQELTATHGNINKLMNWINSNTNKTRVEELGRAQGKTLAGTAEQLNKFLSQANHNEEEKKKLQSALDQLKEYQKTAATTIDMADADVNSAIMMVSSALEEKYQILIKSLQELLTFQDRSGQAQYDRAMNRFNQTVWVFTLVLLAAVFLSVGVNIYLARLISGPVRRANETVQQIAEGDLTRELQVTAQDEVGQLAQAIDEMRRKFGDAVGQSVAMSLSLAEAASEQAASI